MHQTARRVSNTIKLPARRLSGMVSDLSQKSLLSGGGDNHRVRFETEKTVHSYPSSQSFLPDEDLWYSQAECNQMIIKDVDAIAQAENLDEADTRGLELFFSPERVHKRGATKRYVITMVRKDHTIRQSAVKLVVSKKKLERSMDSLNRYSVQVTAADKDFAYRLACADEIEAREIHLEDGKMESSFPGHQAKRGSLITEAATLTTVPQLRQSATAKSA